MKKIEKVFSLIVVMLFLCQNISFCAQEKSFTLRPPSHFSESTERFIREYGAQNVPMQAKKPIAPIRVNKDDFFGKERQGYLKNIKIGALPKELEERANSYPWPIDMAANP